MGSFGHAACFSFYPGKNLGAFGDAGAVVTNDAHLAVRIRRLANHGRGSGKHNHQDIGTNSRLDNLQAGVLAAKLSRLDDWNAARRAAAEKYDELLSPWVDLTEQKAGAEGVHHLYVVRTERRQILLQHLQSRNIAAGLHYPIPCHLQPPFIASARSRLPVSEDAARRLLSLPMFPHISESAISATAHAVIDHVKTHRRVAIA